MANTISYETELHTETYKGHDLEVEGDPTEWEVRVYSPEEKVWEPILWITSEYCSLEEAIEDAHAEVDKL